MMNDWQNYASRHYLDAWADESGRIAVCKVGSSPNYRMVNNITGKKQENFLTMPTLEECQQTRAQCTTKNLPTQFVQTLFLGCFFPAVAESLRRGQNITEAREIADYLMKEDLLPNKYAEELRKLLEANRDGNSTLLSDEWETGGLEAFMACIEDKFNTVLTSLRSYPKVATIDNPQYLLSYLAVQQAHIHLHLQETNGKKMADLLISAFDSLMILLKTIENYQGTIIELGNDSEFITSDNPVIDYSLQGEGVFLGLFYPISPKRGLLLLSSVFATGPGPIHPWVEFVNDRMFYNSCEEIYATNTTLLKKYIRPIGMK